MPSDNRTIRKAAILIRSLDRATAKALLAQLPQRDAARVRQMVHELGDIDAIEQQEVLDEFVHRGERQRPALDGIELAGSLATLEVANTESSFSPSPRPATPAFPSFHLLNQSGTNELASF